MICRYLFCLVILCLAGCVENSPDHPVARIENISPQEGGTGTTLTITGDNFVLDRNHETSVSIGGTAATITSITKTQIICTVPAIATQGTKSVVVTTIGGVSNAFSFDYFLSPVITGISPLEGTSDTPLTITGDNFTLARDRATSVSIGGTAATITSATKTQIVCTVPDLGSSGTQLVQVTTSGGASNTANFGYWTAPTIAGISPDQGPANTATAITISGTNFTHTPTGRAQVTIGGSSATNIVVVDSGTITCTTPLLANGEKDVIVICAGGSVTATNGFTCTPTIASLKPVSGVMQGKTLVTITGKGFITGATVKFGTRSATSVTVVGPTQITCLTPTGAREDYADYVRGVDVNVLVTNPDTANATLLNGFRYINNKAVCTVVSTKFSQQTTSDGNGGAVIAWADYRNGNNDIYAQRLDANGNSLWPAVGLPVCTAANEQFSLQIGRDGSGGVIITWQDRRNGTGNDDIYAQRVAANGNPLWTANGVAICTATGLQTVPQITGDGNGGAIITWPDRRNGTGNEDIYAQRVDTNGNPLWTANGVAICTAANFQSAPQITGDGSGGAIITWPDFRSGSRYDIYAQRVDANGNPLWTANGVAICTAVDQKNPQLVADGSGGAIIVWEDYRSGSSNCDIYAQRVDANGNRLWTLNGVAICQATGHQQYPQLVGDDSGSAIIAWQDYRNGSSNTDIYAQRVTADGNLLWAANGLAICPAAGWQGSLDIAGDGNGGAIISWQDGRNGSGNGDIYAQRVTADGNLLWAANGLAICTAPLQQSTPQIAGDGSGGAIIAWPDGRNGTSAIYAQKVNADASLGE